MIKNKLIPPTPHQTTDVVLGSGVVFGAGVGFVEDVVGVVGEDVVSGVVSVSV